MKKLTFVSFGVLLASISPALAYTGPGLGAATIAVVVGFITSIAVGLFAVVWYPVKRMMRNRKKNSAGAETAKAEVDTSVSADASSESEATESKSE